MAPPAQDKKESLKEPADAADPNKKKLSKDAASASKKEPGQEESSDKPADATESDLSQKPNVSPTASEKELALQTQRELELLMEDIDSPHTSEQKLLQQSEGTPASASQPQSHDKPQKLRLSDASALSDHMSSVSISINVAFQVKFKVINSKVIVG